MTHRICLIVSLLLPLGSLLAEESAEQKIRESLTRTFPALEITRIKESRVTGLYEVLLGPDVIYMSADGQYILQGDLIDIRKRKNLSEEQRSFVRKTMLETIPAGEYIEFGGEQRKHTIYVFTDIDCGYCRKLHQDMAQLNRLGIAVRYLAFPRAGIASGTSRQMQAVWCADNRKKAMNEAKQGMKVTEKSCKNPVANQYKMGQEIGVQGTPAIYSDRGLAISGYMPPDRLLQALNSQ